MKKSLILFLLASLMPIFALILGASFNNVAFVENVSLTYSLLKTISKQKYDYALNISAFNEEDSKLSSLKNISYNFQMSYRVYGPSSTSSFVACFDNDVSSYTFSFMQDEIDHLITPICLPAYCSGNTVNNILFELELEMMFSFKCDWNVNYGDNFDSPSYISQSTADKILENSDSFFDYEDLLGKSISIQVGENIRTYSINNIFYSDKYLSPVVESFLNDFIIVNDSFIIENSSPKIATFLKSDFFLFNDFIRFFKKIDISSSNFYIFSEKDNSWIQTGLTHYFDDLLANEKTYTINLLMFVLGIVGIAASFISLIIYFLKKKYVNKRLMITILLLNSIVPLLFINVINLYFFENYLLLTYFNWFSGLLCCFSLGILVYFMLRIFKNEKNKSANKF